MLSRHVRSAARRTGRRGNYFPPNVSWTVPTLVSGTAMDPVAPVNVGGPVEGTGAYSDVSSTPLSTYGLSLNADTGILSGTPNAAMNGLVFDITITGTRGSQNATMTITSDWFQAGVWPPTLSTLDLEFYALAGITPVYQDAGKTTLADVGDPIHVFEGDAGVNDGDIIWQAGATKMTLEVDETDSKPVWRNSEESNKANSPYYVTAGNAVTSSITSEGRVMIVVHRKNSADKDAGNFMQRTAFLVPNGSVSPSYRAPVGAPDELWHGEEWSGQAAIEAGNDWHATVLRVKRYDYAEARDGLWLIQRDDHPAQPVYTYWQNSKAQIGDNNGQWQTPIAYDLRALIMLKGDLGEAPGEADIAVVLDALKELYPGITIKNPPNLSYADPGVISTGDQTLYLSPTNIGAAVTTWTDVDSIGSVTGVTFNSSTGLITFDPPNMAAGGPTSYTIRGTAADGSYDEVEVVVEVELSIQDALLQDLAHYWHLEEDTPNDKVDEVGGKNLVEVVAPTRESMKFGYGQSLSGAVNAVGLQNSSFACDLSQKLYMAWWFITTDMDSARSVFRVYDTTAAVPLLGAEFSTVELKFMIGNGINITSVAQVNALGLTENVLSFVEFYWDPAEGSFGTAGVAIDGGAWQTAAASAAPTARTGDLLQFGPKFTGGSFYPRAKIDEIYWRVGSIPDATIRAAFYDGGVGKTYPFDGSGPTAKRILYPTTLQTFELGVPITPIDPTFQAYDGSGNTFSVTPSLPSGLSLGTDGRIHGAPSAVSAETVYRIDDDTDGIAWGSIRIAVVDTAAPASAQMGEG